MTPQKFPRKEIKRLSYLIAEILIAAHTGDVNEPQTWVVVATALGCHVCSYHKPYGKDGEYAPAGLGKGVICFNTARTPRRQVLVLIHEITHHILWPHEQGVLFGEVVSEGYEDSPGDVRHKIARAVEAMIMQEGQA